MKPSEDFIAVIWVTLAVAAIVALIIGVALA